MRRKIAQYIRTWEKRGYRDGIPDEADPRLESLCKVPSYRAICRAIIRNDTALVSLGFMREQTPAYVALKRIELAVRAGR